MIKSVSMNESDIDNKIKEKIMNINGIIADYAQSGEFYNSSSGRQRFFSIPINRYADIVDYSGYKKQIINILPDTEVYNNSYEDEIIVDVSRYYSKVNESVSMNESEVTYHGRRYKVKSKEFLNGKLAGYNNENGLERIGTVKMPNGNSYSIYDSGFGNMRSSYACAIKIENIKEENNNIETEYELMEIDDAIEKAEETKEPFEYDWDDLDESIKESIDTKFSDPKMEKLRKIIIANGTVNEENNNYTIDGSLRAWYSPSKNEIGVMEPMWGYPRYIYNGKRFYKKNSGGKEATLTRATLITNVLKQLSYGKYSELDMFDDEGNIIKTTNESISDNNLNRGNKIMKLKESKDDIIYEPEFVDDYEDETFIEDGNEYKWKDLIYYKYIDFDHWAIRSAVNVDTDELVYFIVDEDSDFIDWGPLDTIEEAREFLESKETDEIDESLDEKAYKFEYQLLDRCRQDCKYYLRHGNRNDKRLWAGNVKDQIAKMRELYNTVPVKPEWITLKDIDNYEKRMTDKNSNDLVDRFEELTGLNMFEVDDLATKPLDRILVNKANKFEYSQIEYIKIKDLKQEANKLVVTAEVDGYYIDRGENFNFEEEIIFDAPIKE